MFEPGLEASPIVENRGRFIIDPDFVIRAMQVLTPKVGRNPDELLRQVKAFQHVRATGEVTPSECIFRFTLVVIYSDAVDC